MNGYSVDRHSYSAIWPHAEPTLITLSHFGWRDSSGLVCIGEDGAGQTVERLWSQGAMVADPAARNRRGGRRR